MKKTHKILAQENDLVRLLGKMIINASSLRKRFFFLIFNFLISGLTETAAHLQGAANGQGLPQKSLPNVHQLAKKAMNGYNFELGLLSPPGSAAAEFVTTSSGMNYTSVMATLAKGQLISECPFDFTKNHRQI